MKSFKLIFPLLCFAAACPAALAMDKEKDPKAQKTITSTVSASLPSTMDSFHHLRPYNYDYELLTLPESFRNKLRSLIMQPRSLDGHEYYDSSEIYSSSPSSSSPLITPSITLSSSSLPNSTSSSSPSSSSSSSSTLFLTRWQGSNTAYLYGRDTGSTTTTIQSQPEREISISLSPKGLATIALFLLYTHMYAKQPSL